MQAQLLNMDIFETIYYHALKTSSNLAAKEGPYLTYSGSPLSKVLDFRGFSNLNCKVKISFSMPKVFLVP